MASTTRRGIGDEPPPKRQDTGRKKGGSKRPLQRATSPPKQNNEKTIAERLYSSVSQADRKASWLSVLTRRELTDLALGADWQSGDPHPHNCFVCDIANDLLKCQHCPRSYHRTCLDPPLDDSVALDDWVCPACALLGEGKPTHTYLLDRPAGQGAHAMIRIESAANVEDGHEEGNEEPGSRHSQRRVQNARQLGRSKQAEPTSAAHSSRPEDVPSFEGPDSGLKGQSIVVDPGVSLRNDSAALSDHYSGRKAGTNNHQSLLKKRSRYSTLPDEVDEALATINRQLEAGVHSQTVLQHISTRNQALEQELRIEKGKALLSTRNEKAEAEMITMKTRFQGMEHELEELRSQNQQLKSDAEESSKKIRALEAWKLRMKAMIDGDGGD